MTTDNAVNQARAQYENVRRMVRRLDHIQECASVINFEDCDADHAEVWEAIDSYGVEDDKEAYAEYHDQESVEMAIQEDALSVEVRSGWVLATDPLEPSEYRIVLCTGGPHVEIRGELDLWAEPHTARLCYRDWFTELEVWSDADEDVLLAYAQQFYFAA